MVYFEANKAIRRSYQLKMIKYEYFISKSSLPFSESRN